MKTGEYEAHCLECGAVTEMLLTDEEALSLGMYIKLDHNECEGSSLVCFKD